MTTPTDDELILSVRNYAYFYRLSGHTKTEADLLLAADRLAALAKERNEIASDRDRLEGMCYETKEKLERVIAERDWLREACQALFDADHPDHFAARLSDSECAALNRVAAELKEKP